jgi:hypothetical protein
MRIPTLALLLLVALPGAASAATGSWLDGLFVPAHRAVHHRSTPKPAATPAKPATAPVAADAPDATTPNAAPPVPMPRERPAQPVEPAAPVTPAPAPAVSAAPAAPATTAPVELVAPAATPSGPQSTLAAPAAAEGDSAVSKPSRVYQTACPAVISGLVEATPLPPISSGQCGEPSPLAVTAVMVNGRMLPLSAPATFGCPMATDFPGWVADVDNYIRATQKTEVKSIDVGESYVCRPRNVPGGSPDLSEHGRADALDFVGFTLADGRKLTVSKDYNSSDAPTARLMHFAHDAACTRFTTVLGPDANAQHQDHFHLDLGCHGKTCTFRLCE